MAGKGIAYAEQMESITTKGSGPASIYSPSEGFKRIYRHPQPYGDGEPTGAVPTGRKRQDRGTNPGSQGHLLQCFASPCMFFGTTAVLIHLSLGVMLLSSQNIKRREDEEQGTQNILLLGAVQPLHHHLHGHSTAEDPAAGSSPRCQGTESVLLYQGCCSCRQIPCAPGSSWPLPWPHQLMEEVMLQVPLCSHPSRGTANPLALEQAGSGEEGWWEMAH